jgi:sugar transferase EpsL
MYQQFGKRFCDLAIGIPALIILAPYMGIIALTLRLSLDKGSPFYIQKRPGQHAILFDLIKFRTMKDVRNIVNSLLPDSRRITRFGSILRRSSLDELPELWNVIKGDMSIIGPRPLLVEYLDRYTPEQTRRHEVKPGITGWAQVNGRNALTWENKFKLDVWYVDSISFWLDVKIMLMTIWKVIKQEGINQRGQATMSEFLGYNDAK